MNLREIIAAEIRESGPMPFSRYMELCLYHPELGYYCRNAEQFGKSGDFYTSSDVHAVFGRLLARQFEEMWRSLGSPSGIEILELGPGKGLFARDVLDWSEKKFPGFYEALHYSLAERSPALRQRLDSTLDRQMEAGKATLASMPVESADPSGVRFSPGNDICTRALHPSVPLIVFGNEFFDAFPVEILSDRGRLHLAFEGSSLAEVWLPPAPEQLEYLDRYGVHPEADERLEVSFIAQASLSRLAGGLRRGFFVVIDYGYTRDEQLAGRHRGTLAACRRHSRSSNPYEAPGEQDLTAHVNFTALAAAAEEAGIQCHRLVTQSQFLLGIGEQNQFADVFEDCKLPQERAKAALQLKHLITPEGVGEAFHVLAGCKGVENQGLLQLSGLSFGAGR